MDTKYPRTGLSRGATGFCPDWCKNYHGAVSKTDDKFCKFVSDNTNLMSKNNS